MELYFLRHGVAAEAAPEGGGDADRRLTKDGIIKMKAAARGMRRLGLKIDVLLSSPLARAHETAQIVARELGAELQLSDALAPGCDLTRLLDLLGEHRIAERVMFVGHEPDFSTLISVLTGGGQVQLKKGSLARVDIEVLEAGTGVLAWLLAPRVLRALE
ncbi:MAG: phosphohistidine phosphatase SixA [Kouleothrix sp.]|jgi:phosphohistidine phosphatase|nr:phosphohistidine phosphatase SixA [Kouleothrix sp.]